MDWDESASETDRHLIISDDTEYRIDRSPLLYSHHKMGKSTRMTSCLPCRLIDLIGGPLVWRFDEEESNHVSNTFVQY